MEEKPWSIAIKNSIGKKLSPYIFKIEINLGISAQIQGKKD